MHQLFPQVFKKAQNLLTKNLVPGFKSYTEEIITENDTEYRVWEPRRSKLAAAIVNGLKTFPFKKGSKILYLGIAQGYTSSFISDIIGSIGIVYGIEISERAFQDLNPVAAKRKNIVPILANARVTKDYDWIEPVDVVFQDVATSDQSEILIRNAKFLKQDGVLMIAIKARSIDVTKEPKKVFKQELEKLSKHFEILEKISLEPYEKAHMFVVLKPKK